MCKKCDERREAVIEQQSPETLAKLDKIQEVAKELETLLVDVMMPTEMTTAPGSHEIEQRLVMFFEGEIDRVMKAATLKVMERWPEQMMTPEQEDALREDLTAIIEDMTAALPLGEEPPGEPDPEDIDITKLN